MQLAFLLILKTTMNKKNLILGGLLLVLLVLAFVYQGPFGDWRKKEKKELNIFSDLNVDNVNKIELSGSKGKKVFVKNASLWQEEGIKNSMLNSQAVDSALSSLKQSKEENPILISELADKQADFETSTEKGYKVVLKNGDEVIKDFVIGKNTNDFRGSYVSETGSNKTYISSINLTSVFGHDDWLNKSIFVAESSPINKIRFQYPSREFTVEKP